MRTTATATQSPTDFVDVPKAAGQDGELAASRARDIDGETRRRSEQPSLGRLRCRTTQRWASRLPFSDCSSAGRLDKSQCEAAVYLRRISIPLAAPHLDLLPASVSYVADKHPRPRCRKSSTTVNSSAEGLSLICKSASNLVTNNLSTNALRSCFLKPLIGASCGGAASHRLATSRFE